MRVLLSQFLFLFGAVCVAIALTHILIGPSSIPGGVVTNAVMDSEDRFYASLFLGYGLAIIWCARNLGSRERPLAALLAVLFLGGIARIISLVAVGSPGPIFLTLGALELLLPPLIWWWLIKTRSV
jgi:hypothetical protein